MESVLTVGFRRPRSVCSDLSSKRRLLGRAFATRVTRATKLLDLYGDDVFAKGFDDAFARSSLSRSGNAGA
jgi:hypothetical protein